MTILFQKDKIPGNEKSITTFIFRTGDNIVLSSDAEGIINNTAITVYVPTGTDITALIPHIEFTGESISPDSGLPQDFSQPVIYTVTATDKSAIEYTAEVVQAPKIVSITSSTPNGYYNEGKPINIAVTFCYPVYLNGTLDVALNTGASVSVTGTNPSSAFTGTYTVAPNQNTGALDATDVILSSGTLVDESGISAILVMPDTTITDSRTIVIDTIPPVLVSAAGNIGEPLLAIIFSEPVNGSIAVSDLTYTDVSGNGAASISSMIDSDGSDKTITVTLNADLASTDNNTDTIAAMVTIQDAAGNSADTAAKTIIAEAVLTQTLKPNAPGDETFITSNHQYPGSGEHWDKVDEEVSDEDNTYVTNEWYTEGSWGARDLYNIPEPARTGTVTNIKIFCGARQNDGNGSIRIAIKTGGTIYESSDISTTSSYANYSNEWSANPNTGIDWTWDDIDALQIGANLFKTSGKNSRMTQMYIEIEYTP